MTQRTPIILGIDAGGTMTDTFIIDESGEFIVGKAQTTPQDEAVGFMNSAKDGLKYWNMTIEDGFPSLETGIYSGTAMLNRLLERKVVASGSSSPLARKTICAPNARSKPISVIHTRIASTL